MNSILSDEPQQILQVIQQYTKAVELPEQVDQILLHQMVLVHHSQALAASKGDQAVSQVVELTFQVPLVDFLVVLVPTWALEDRGVGDQCLGHILGCQLGQTLSADLQEVV